MMTPLPRCAAALMLAAVLCSCPETTVPEGFGAGPLPLKPAEWEGVWAPVDEPEEAFTFQVPDAAQGILELRGAEAGREKQDDFTLALRQTGGKDAAGLAFAILKEKKKPGGGGLHLMRRLEGGRAFLLWAIDHKEVGAALKAGELKGSVTADKDGDHNALAADPANSAALLAPRFWRWTEPTVMVRR